MKVTSHQLSAADLGDSTIAIFRLASEESYWLTIAERGAGIAIVGKNNEGPELGGDTKYNGRVCIIEGVSLEELTELRGRVDFAIKNEVVRIKEAKDKSKKPT